MLAEKYKKEIVSTLKKELKIENPMAIPKVAKVVVNMGIAEAKDDRSLIDLFSSELETITGQKPFLCPARRSISGFKLRKGQVIGLKVTLRGKRMYAFLERLFNLVLPRLRDFRGLSPDKFDQAGNYNIGLPEQTVFPEIDIDKVKKIKGLQVTIVTNTKDKVKAKALLKHLGLPFSG